MYVKQIYEASCKHVIFYDVGDKRAWLVNGATALLHLARAYLVFASKQLFLSTMTKFRLEDLWAPDEEYEASAPFKILCNSKNMDLVIYEDWKPANEAIIDAEGNFSETAKVKDAHFRFRDQVDEIYHIWEQIQEFQTKMTDNIRATGRNKLQGFNFIDIATGESPIKPRYTYLEPSSNGWVDLARSLDAITLFGRGFGELIQPSSESNTLCHSWCHVPTGSDYLAVSVSDVRAIFDKRGNALERPMQLVDGLFWHKADKLFEPCECAIKDSRKRRFILGRGDVCDRLQVLLPQSSRRKTDPGPLEERGAVIFGKSERYHWNKPDRGPPKGTTGPDEDPDSERPQKKARSSSSSEGSQKSENSSADTPPTSATTISEDAASSSRTETPVKR